MQSIAGTSNATGDSDDFEYISNTEDRLLIASGPANPETSIPTIEIVKNIMTEKQPQRSRCRRKGARFYILILVTIVSICAAVLYYSPFKAREAKWKGSASFRSGHQGHYSKKGKKLAGVNFDVQRLKGNNAKALANIPLR